MKMIMISGSILGLLILGGCAADPTNDPRTGGFFGGMRGLAAGDYEVRQQELQGQRDESLNQLRALREEGADLETERQMKADEVAAQRRQLASLKARNRALAAHHAARAQARHLANARLGRIRVASAEPSLRAAPPRQSHPLRSLRVRHAHRRRRQFLIPPGRITELMDHPLLALFPKPALVMFIDIDPEIGAARKSDGTPSAYLADRREYYREMARILDAPLIDGTPPIERVFEAVWAGTSVWRAARSGEVSTR